MSLPPWVCQLGRRLWEALYTEDHILIQPCLPGLCRNNLPQLGFGGGGSRLAEQGDCPDLRGGTQGSCPCLCLGHWSPGLLTQ